MARGSAPRRLLDAGSRPSDEETLALLNLLADAIEADCYPLSPRVQMLRQILATSGELGPKRTPPAAPRRRWRRVWGRAAALTRQSRRPKGQTHEKSNHYSGTIAVPAAGTGAVGDGAFYMGARYLMVMSYWTNLKYLA